jgi:hypothetical protein
MFTFTHAIVFFLLLMAQVLLYNAWSRYIVLKEKAQEYERTAFAFAVRQYEEQMQQRRVELHLHCLKAGLPVPADVMNTMRRRTNEEDDLV